MLFCPFHWMFSGELASSGSTRCGAIYCPEEAKYLKWTWLLGSPAGRLTVPGRKAPLYAIVCPGFLLLYHVFNSHMPYVNR